MTDCRDDVLAKHRERVSEQDQRSVMYWLSEIMHGGPIKTIFDVGAHIGYSVSSWEALCPNATIHAFEPCSDTYRKLEANVAALSRVVPHQLAIGCQSAMADFHCNADSQTSSLLDVDSLGAEYVPADLTDLQVIESVQVDTVANVCERLGVEQVDLLKIDTQGKDLDVLLGAGEMLRPSTIRAIMIEVNFVPMYEDQASAEDIIGALLHAGYGIHGWVNIAHCKDGTWKWADLLCVGRS